jgi:acyl-CoA dehydrogenase
LNIAKITLRRAAQKNAAQHEDGVATTAACAA